MDKAQTGWMPVIAVLSVVGCASVSGNVERGRAVFVEREQGHCVICHAAPGVAVAGDVGPSLAGVGSRLTPGEIRASVADITLLKPDAAMPAFHRTDNLSRVASNHAGRPILSEQQLEDVTAWLLTLRGREAPSSEKK